MAEPTSINTELERLFARGLELRVSDEELRAWESEQAARERRGRLETSGIADRMDADGLARVLADDLEPSRSLELVRAWMLSSRPALVLMGPPGVGKTVAAAWALARCSGRYVRARDLCDMHLGRGAARVLYEAHRTCSLLVVDELGLERDPAAARETMDDIVDSRLRLPRRTLLLGNIQSRGDLVDRYDERMLDRLGVHHDEDGIALFRRVDGRSRRRSGGGDV